MDADPMTRLPANTVKMDDGSCAHARLAYMNTTGGALCIDCHAVFPLGSPEDKRAELELKAAMTDQPKPSHEAALRERIAAWFESRRQTAASARHQYEAGAKERTGVEHDRYLDYAHAESVRDMWLRETESSLLYDLRTELEQADASASARQAENERLREALTELMRQWGADVDGCLACAGLDNDGPCEACMTIVRCSGSLEGTIQRVDVALHPPAAERLPWCKCEPPCPPKSVCPTDWSRFPVPDPPPAAERAQTAAKPKMPEPLNTHLGWLLAKVMKDPAYPEARVLWEQFTNWQDAAVADPPPVTEPLTSSIAAIPGPAHPLRSHADGFVGLRVRDEPSQFLHGEIAAIARVLAGCERRLRAAIGEQP